MEKETLKNIMHFLENEENKSSFKWKLKNDEPLTKDELVVKGNLGLQFSKLTSLPEGLKVRGNLYLYSTKIKSLPEGLSVGGTLDLENCTNLTSLPKGLEVGWDLIINGTKLQKYTDDELREMINLGYIKGDIIR
jgi:hypothetical protein